MHIWIRFFFPLYRILFPSELVNNVSTSSNCELSLIIISALRSMVCSPMLLPTYVTTSFDNNCFASRSTRRHPNFLALVNTIIALLRCHLQNLLTRLCETLNLQYQRLLQLIFERIEVQRHSLILFLWDVVLLPSDLVGQTKELGHLHFLQCHAVKEKW
jgi:hypothetical protein